MLIEDFTSYLKNSKERSLTKLASIPSTMPVNGNEDKFIKISSNIYKPDPNFIDDREFWKISETPEGKFFIRVFSNDSETPRVNTSNWKISVHEESESLVLSYKDKSLFTIKLASLDCDIKDALLAKTVLLHNMNSNSKFASVLISEYASDKMQFIKNEHPEIFS